MVGDFHHMFIMGMSMGVNQLNVGLHHRLVDRAFASMWAPPTFEMVLRSVGVWTRWGATKCGSTDLPLGGLAHHLAPHFVSTCHLQYFVDMWWFWFLIIFASFGLDQAWLVAICTWIQIMTCTCGTKWIVPMSLLSCSVLSPKLNHCWRF